MSNQYNPDGFIPKHGGYKRLLSYQKAEAIYDGTRYFCKKYFQRYDRTIDQMVQAARSGKQNIVEGSMASGTSKEMEIKLTNVARASLEELLDDYKDFLRDRKLQIWNKQHPYYPQLHKRITTPNANYATYQKGIESPDPEVSANVLIGLINLTSYLLAKQIKSLEDEFLHSGGLRERMSKARMEVCKKRLLKSSEK
ncbi:MAG: four helix bundle suffix domain-containing protein [Prolixibacteraceae bacterium]|jgi:four helix bundle suffix protein|nr:four helix bundle suffix domain-containing protein [Prolixibacteraceae bacterium]